jgi:hypothetical protein
VSDVFLLHNYVSAILKFAVYFVQFVVTVKHHLKKLTSPIHKTATHAISEAQKKSF